VLKGLGSPTNFAVCLSLLLVGSTCAPPPPFHHIVTIKGFITYALHFALSQLDVLCCQMTLEESFFRLHSSSLRRSVEFVAERLTSNWIKLFQAETLAVILETGRKWCKKLALDVQPSHNAMVFVYPPGIVILILVGTTGDVGDWCHFILVQQGPRDGSLQNNK